MELYCCKNEECEGEDQNAGYKVVIILVSRLEHMEHVITADNWFTSPILFLGYFEARFQSSWDL